MKHYEGSWEKDPLFWSPRILTILFIGFISLFALDVFDEELGFWQALSGFLIHLIPTYILIVTLVFAWRWEWVGTIVCTGFALFYIFSYRGHWSSYFVISGPLLIIAVLFILGWLKRKEIKTAQ
ncbi:MAG: hypothetical protein PHH86_03050 [Sphaerochaetaceae bacterium]|nr:hypothetical protein [Sphaerochaetaceae bacterium]